MAQTEINNVDTTETPTDIESCGVLLEETKTTKSLTQSKEVCTKFFFFFLETFHNLLLLLT